MSQTIFQQTGMKLDGIYGNTIKRFCICETAGNTAAKTATPTAGSYILENGAIVLVEFINTNTANNPTLNIGSTGAKSIKIGSEVLTNTTVGVLAGVVAFVYNNNYYYIINSGVYPEAQGGMF